MSHGLEEGSSSPLGATPSPSGVNAEPERQRVALNQLIREADITWHGVRNSTSPTGDTLPTVWR